jgi:hypothetical protein
MDKEALQNWLETEEGKQWAGEYKSGLVNKNSELLAAIHKSDADMAAINQRLTEAEGNLEAERAITSGYLIDAELTRLLKQANVFEEPIPRIVSAMKSAYGLTVKVDGDNRTAIGMLKNESGEDTEAALDAVVAAWAKEPDSKFFIKCTSTGGGATGSSSRGAPPPALNRLSGQALAAMSDEQFNSIRNNQLQSNGG